MEQVKHVIDSMSNQTEIDRRNRAVVSFTLVTGARDSAIASMKLKHVDLAAGSVYQDARDVKTKFSKTFTTFFFPVGEGMHQIVATWVKYLREDKLWGNDDPLFPATHVVNGENRQFVNAGLALARTHWNNATAIRGIFREAAFNAAGLPYFNPHSLRHTLGQLGQTCCQTPEQFKAWSQNLGHEEVLTTFCSYGQVASARQGEIIRDLVYPQSSGSPSAEEIADAVARKLRVQSGSDCLGPVK